MEMQRMNGTVQNLKEAWQKMPGKTKKMIAVIAAGTIILAAAGLLVLNIGTKKGYSTLFTGMSSDDAQAVVSLLQDEGVDYRYNDKNGSVQVMSDTVDKTRAELLSKGYPKSAGVSLLAFEVYASYIKSVARSFYSQLLLLWIPMRTKFPLCFLSAFFLILFLFPFIQILSTFLV